LQNRRFDVLGRKLAAYEPNVWIETTRLGD
jgi:hypothetical protein